MNEKSELELSHFNLSKERARKIAIRKQKVGEFNRIEDILELDGFGVKVLEKFCNSILSNPEKTKQEEIIEDEGSSALSQKKVTYVTPPIVNNVRNRITSCVAFHVDLNYIGWSRLTVENSDKSAVISNMNKIVLDDWACFEIGHEDKKQSLSDLIEVLINLNELVPQADVYVLESLPVQQAAKQPGNIVQMNVNVQKSQLFAMLSILAATRKADIQNFSEPELEPGVDEVKPLKEPRVYFLRNFLSSRLFRTFIGNERVSTAITMEEIFKEQQEELKPYGYRYVAVPQELRDHYGSSSNIYRDFMGQSFLNGLAFMKLCVLKCPGTAEMLNRRKKV